MARIVFVCLVAIPYLNKYILIKGTEDVLIGKDTPALLIHYITALLTVWMILL